jgi:hypothetical protein
MRNVPCAVADGKPICVYNAADFIPPPRPRTRSECKDGPRPCPWFSCRHHLGLDLAGLNGNPRLTWPELDIDELPETCALDVADRDEHNLAQIARLLNLSRERVRQIEEAGLQHLNQALQRLNQKDPR